MADPTIKGVANAPLGTQHVSVPEQLKAKRARMGWSLRYAAARLGLSEENLRRFEGGFPIAVTSYRRVMKVYNRAFFVMTQGLARQSKGVFR